MWEYSKAWGVHGKGWSTSGKEGVGVMTVGLGRREREEIDVGWRVVRYVRFFWLERR